MDKSLILSGEQLLELKCLYQEEKKMRRKKKRINSGNMPDKREEIPSDMRNIEQDVNRRLKERFNVLGTGRVRSSSDMGLAEWCPQSKSSKVISSKKRSPWMGFTENNQLMYTPEETIFLMESECILINYMGAQLSLQSAYQIILSDNQLGKYYQIYAYLTRLGFKLKSSQRDNKTGSVSGTNSSIDAKTIKDALNQKINQLGSKPISMTNSNNLKMITMPLRRQMFLNGTSFDRIATWSEYKRLIEPREPSKIFDEEATVLEVNDEIRSTDNIFDQLPNKSLIDYTTNLKPLIDQTKFIDINKLHEIMKKSGPQERNLHKLLPPSKYQPEIRYQVFSRTVQNFSSIEPDHYVVICSNPFPPMVQELISTSEKCRQSTPIYAVTSNSEFNFSTLEPFDLWNEVPTFWDSNIPSR